MLFCHESFAWRSAFPVFQVLADALSINQTITDLWLSHSKIGDNGMKVWWVERCGASQGSCVKSGRIRAEICGASLEVMGSRRIWSKVFIVGPWTFLGFERLLDSLLGHMISTLFLNMEGTVADSFVGWSSRSGKVMQAGYLVFRRGGETVIPTHLYSGCHSYEISKQHSLLPVWD